MPHRPVHACPSSAARGHAVSLIWLAPACLAWVAGACSWGRLAAVFASRSAGRPVGRSFQFRFFCFAFPFYYSVLFSYFSLFIFLLRVLKSSKNHQKDVQNEAGNRKGQGPPFSPTTITVFVFVTKELEGQRAPFLPNMMNGFFINHNEPDDGPEAFSGCSRLRGGRGRLRGAVLDLNKQRTFPGFFMSILYFGGPRGGP